MVSIKNPLIMISTYFLVVMIPCANSLSFNLMKINSSNQNREIVTVGEGSYVSDDGIQVTPDTGSDRNGKAGQAKYSSMLHLWDKKSRQLADFTTNFSFIISSRSSDYADGLTFFLAEDNSVIENGGGIGLPVHLVNDTTYEVVSSFVAVEIDTHANSWDPSDSNNEKMLRHVGININSLNSVSYKKWDNDMLKGNECTAWIKYDSVSKNLSVSFTGYVNSLVVQQVELEYTTDLRNELPERVIFGFTAATGDSFEKNTVTTWSFDSSDLQIAENNGTRTQTSNTKEGHEKKKKNKGFMVALIAGLGVPITALMVVAFVMWKKKNGVEELETELEPDVEMNHEFENGTGPRRFSYNELSHATLEFAEEEKLGEGGFGEVYRGLLEDSRTRVAVKKVSKDSKQGIKEYASEVRIISRLRHRNLVQLIGWCHEKAQLLLVYELMENKSLDSHLFEAKSLLTWGVRYKIAQGLASALLYLHEGWEQCVLHRDIKSSNVMLDSKFNAKLGDFGLARFVDHEKSSQTTTLAGTMGYMAPEYQTTGKASKESDVYSFGIVALEIATGRKPIQYKEQQRPIRLIEWVWELYGTSKLLEAADARLGSDFVEEEMIHLMIVGLWCAHPDPELRPLMTRAVQVLNINAPLPTLPSKMPVPTCFSPITTPLYGITLISESSQT